MFVPGAYEVEREVFSGKFYCHFEQKDGMTVPDQREIVDRLVDHFGLEPITTTRLHTRTREPNYTSHAQYRKRIVTMGATAGPAVVCHEVAHIMNGTDGSLKDSYHHGPSWQAHYVDCVRVILGEWHAGRLEKAFTKFEETKKVNRTKAAAKRGKRRSTAKSGPRVKTIVVPDDLRSKALGKATITWNAPESYLAIRYSTTKGWYWRVSGYLRSDLPDRAEYDVWEELAHGQIDNITPLFTEGQFSTKKEALAWALQRKPAVV